MLIVQILKDDVGRFKTSVVTFDSCRRRLRLYFSSLKKVRDRIIDGEVIFTPYATFRKDRRRESIEVKDERRQPVKAIITK